MEAHCHMLQFTMPCSWHAYVHCVVCSILLLHHYTDDTGIAPCSCKYAGDAQVCGGTDSCSVSFKTGNAYACVYIKMDGNDIPEDDRTETLTLASDDDTITTNGQGQVALLVLDDDCELVCSGDVYNHMYYVCTYML